MIDFHSHILPCMDDGSKSMEETLAILHSYEGQRIDGLILTPHFYPQQEKPEDFLQRRENSLSLLAGCVRSFPLYVGAEVAFFVGIGEYKNLDRLTIRGTNCILIEMPFAKWSNFERDEILAVRDRGFVPVLAHIERYRKLGNKELIYYFSSCKGIYLQSNAEFFLDKKTVRKARRWLKRGIIKLLGSDCHNLTSRPANLGEGLEAIAKKDKQDILSVISERGDYLMQNAERI